MALQDIVSKILNDAELEAKHIIENGEKEYKERLESEKKKIDDYFDKKRMHLNIDIENYIQRQKQVIDLEFRKRILQTRREEIDKIFESTKEKLVHLSKEDYQKIMKKILLASVETGDEEVVIGEYDKNRLDNTFVDSVNKELKNGKLVLSSDFIPESYGFVLRKGNIEINCTLKSILKNKKEELVIQVSKILQEE